MAAHALPIAAAKLLRILSLARPHGSKEVAGFCRRFLDKVPGMTSDAFGNRICRVPRADGSPARVLWSSHVDTVHAKGGVQVPLLGADGIIRLDKGKPGQCLGADDGAGVWLMLEMIAAKRPGLYVFHQGEEVGCLGSRWIVANTPELLSEIDAAIALDRAGFSDVITHQSGGRCASDAFGQAMADSLNRTWGLGFELCDGGVYTDTIEYRALVPECLNLSVGYDKQHGPRETQDFTFLQGLLNALLVLDFDTMPIERVPSDGWGPDSWGDGDVTGWPDADATQEMLDLCAAHPSVAAAMLDACGVSVDDFIDAAWGQKGEMVSGDFRY